MPAKLRDVVAYDDYTVVSIFTSRRWPRADGNLNFGIIPEHIYKPLYDKLGSGHVVRQLCCKRRNIRKPNCIRFPAYAYVMTSRIRNQEIVFKRRDDWYMQNGKQVREKPYLRGSALCD